MTYQIEFPDYPADAMPTMPEGFADRSWKNEPCPCFIHEGSGVVLWIDYADPERREFDTTARFVAQQCTNRDPVAGWQFDGGMIDLFESDDWSAVERSLPRFIATAGAMA